MKASGKTALKLGLALGLLTLYAPLCPATPHSPAAIADRAVEIAKQARDRVEYSGKGVKVSSDALFKDFATRTAELQKLLDARGSLEQAGLLAKGDPLGDGRRAHLNGKILMEVGELKKSCDLHLDHLLRSLQRFDDAVAESLVDSQATRAINSNYEIGLEQYVKEEKGRFGEAAAAAEQALAEFRQNGSPKQQTRLRSNYERAKKRLLRIEQRRQLYEARLKVAAMNQKISGLIREKIRVEGHDISSQFRGIMADLYNCFAQVVPIAESGGTGSPEILANLGFNNIGEFRETLSIVEGATAKLHKVLGEMVNDVLAGLGQIKVIDEQGGLSGEMLSVEEEMEFLRQQRRNWNG
jgi:hypothetical protein